METSYRAITGTAAGLRLESVPLGTERGMSPVGPWEDRTILHLQMRESGTKLHRHFKICSQYGIRGLHPGIWTIYRITSGSAVRTMLGSLPLGVQSSMTPIASLGENKCSWPVVVFKTATKVLVSIDYF